MGFLVTEEQATPWNSISRARWLSDQSMRRLQSVLGAAFPAHPLTAQGLVWRGFTYRVLGDAMCVSIIDKGKPTSARDNLNVEEVFHFAAESHVQRPATGTCARTYRSFGASF